MTRHARKGRPFAISAAVACWLAIFAGISLVAVDPDDGWIGVTVIMAALVGGSAALACLRRGNRNGGTS